MIINKQKTTEISGSVSQPALKGGYLYIYFQDELITIVSIPTPNVISENYNQSIVENYDSFSDNNGNNYSVSVYSSIYDIYWTINPDTLNDVSKNDFRYEVKYNEY